MSASKTSSWVNGKHKRRNMTLALVLLLGLWLFYAIWLRVGNLYYKTMFHRSVSQNNLAMTFKRRLSTQDFHSNLQRPAVDWLKEKQLHANWSIQSRDRLKISALYLPSPQPSNKLVILLHGYRGVPEDLSEIARAYHEIYNFHVLLPSLRAHGESEGNLVGFGWKDRLDLLDLVERSIEQFGPDVEIILHGFSMGGATVLMSGGEALPPQVKGLVADSAYNGLEDELKHMLSITSRIPVSWVMPQIRKFAMEGMGADIRKISAKNQLLKCPLPVLLFHNYQDPVVPVQMAYELAEVNNLSKCHVVLKLFSGAKHCRAFFENQNDYLQTLSDFIETLPPTSQD